MTASRLKQLLWAAGLPVLVASLPILNIFHVNQDQLSAHQLWPPLIIVELVALAIAGLCWLVMRQAYKAGAAATLVLVALLAYSGVWDLYRQVADHFGRMGSWLERPTVFPILVIVGLLLLLYWIRRTKRSLHHPAELLLVLAGSLLAFNLIGIVNFRLTNAQANQTKITSPLANPSATATSTRPDIYYIILDRYASQSTLEQQYNFSDEDFLSGLKNQGFYVADSHANYPFTIQSLASSLNGMYLPTLSPSQQNSVSSQRLFQSMIQNSGVASFLKSQNYSYINLGSWWDPSGTNAQANLNLRYPRGITLIGHTLQLDDFEAVILRETALEPLLTKSLRLGQLTLFATRLDFNVLHRDNTLYELDQLQNSIPQLPGPKFVFAHILLPHPPYVFAADGTPPANSASRSEKTDYLSQMQYANQRISQVIAALTADPTKQPVILLQADEGPYPVRFDGHTTTFDWNTATPAELQQKTGILNAYFLPGGNSNLYPTISPVNSFRLIFNQYLGTNLDLLPDQHFIDNEQKPYKWIDLTAKLGG